MKTQLMKKTLVALTLAGLGLIATGAQANDNQDYGSRYEHRTSHAHNDRRDNDAFRQSQRFVEQVNARQHRQIDRIRDGRESGQLTRSEYRDLMHGQRQIRSMKENFLADGRIDTREFRRLDRAQDLADREIRSEKRDQQARNNHGRSPWYN